MSDTHKQIPDDISREKAVADSLRRKYKGALFGGLRQFRALRQQAPGIIAEFVLAAVFSIAALLILFHDLNVTGLLPTVAFCIKFVVVVGLCFWISGRIWRVIGLANRDRCRFIVTNMWTLATTGILVLSAILYVLNPDAEQPPAPPSAAPTAVTAAPPEPIVPPSHELPAGERVFEGRGWMILRNEDSSYRTALVKEAPKQCSELGEHWVLADRPDFEGLEPELREGGHVGSFWTASRKTNSNLDYFLNADGSSRFRWALSGNDTERIVLCVMAVSIGSLDS